MTKTIVELLGPPAAGKTTLSAAVADKVRTVPEQMRELLDREAPPPPPPGPDRQSAVAELIATAVAGSRSDLPVLVDVGWVALTLFAFSQWPSADAVRLGTRLAEIADRADCVYHAVVWVDADPAELRTRALAVAGAGGRRRTRIEANIERGRTEAALLAAAAPQLHPATVVWLANEDRDGAARELKELLQTETAGLPAGTLVRRLTAACARAPRPADASEGRRPRPGDGPRPLPAPENPVADGAAR